MGCKTKREIIFDYYRPNAEILIIQETHGKTQHDVIWENEWGGKAIFSHGETNARGLAVFVTREIYTKIGNIYTDTQGRLIIFDLDQNDKLVTIVALYAPNEDNPTFFRNIRERIKERGENKVIIGDFNFAMDVEMDRLNTYNNNNKAKEEICQIMDEFFMKEIWRIRNPEKKGIFMDKKRRFKQSK